MMSMSLCCGQALMQVPELTQGLILDYNVTGDIDLFSLHRIKHRIPTLDLHPLVRARLINEILKENAEYRKEQKNARYCLTASGVDNAVHQTVDALRTRLRGDLTRITDEDFKDQFRSVCVSAIETQDSKMRTWFADNYDNLLYDQSGKIPFPVVLAMRQRFRRWASERNFSFNEDILMFIEEVATSVGINTKKYPDYKSIWEELKSERYRDPPRI